MNSLLKFDGPQLEELLVRVQQELGPEVTIIEANRTRRGGVAGFFAKEWFEVIVDPGGEGGEPPADLACLTAARDAETDPWLEMASAVDDVREVSHPRPDELTSSSRPSPAFELALAAAGRAVVRSDAPAAPASDLTTSTGPAPAARAVVPAPATTRLRDLDLVAMLPLLDTMTPARLVPVSQAAVVAVVGDRHAVHRAAESVAVQLGLDRTDVVVASPTPGDDVAPWLRLSRPEEVTARTARWKRGGHRTVVAVELEPGAEGHAWAAGILGALDADQVRLVAKAWQLTDQLATKAAALGGVDGIELIEMDTAAEPELFLELGMDVLGIDGRPATSELWAALLLERRNDADHQ